MNKNLNLGSFVLDLDNNLYGIIIESLNSDEGLIFVIRN